MIKITLVEDEPMVARRLHRFITEVAQHKASITTFNNLDDAQDHLAATTTDVLFLDLNLHGKDGFSLLHQHLAEPYHTIIVSANTDRAIDAFELGVLDFIGKPFTKERVEAAIQRYFDASFKGQCKRLSYKKHDKLHFVSLDDIQFIQASGHYSEITTKNDVVILHDKHLDKLMQLLPDIFMRVHRSYAVSLNEIESVSQKSGAKYYAHLKSGSTIPVGRTKFDALMAALQR